MGGLQLFLGKLSLAEKFNGFPLRLKIMSDHDEVVAGLEGV